MCWGLYRAACLLRPALVVPLCPVSCGPCVFCVAFVCGVAGSCCMEIYTPVHISCMCYVSCLKVTRWLQHDVRDGLFAHSVGNDAEWFGNFWNWLRKHENAFLVHDVLFHQLCG